MKRILTLSVALCLLVSSFAAGTTAIVIPKKSPAPNANQILIAVGKNGEKISLMELSVIKAKDYETLTGKKMNLTNKLAFKIIQNKLRNSIKANGDIKTKILEKTAFKAKKASEKTHKYLMLWLILLGAAIVLGIIGWAVPFFWILSSLAGLGALIFFILWILSLSGTM
jgi:hypothetical protein